MLKRKKSSNQVSEPDVSNLLSSAQQIRSEIIISTLEEQEEANYLYWLSLTPTQRLELHYKMITAIYKDTLMKKIKNNQKIIFSL